MSAATIRPAEARDAAAIAAIYAPSVTDAVTSFELVAPDAAAMAGRIADISSNYPYLVCEREDDGQILGYAYASQHMARAAYDWSVNVTVYIRADCHRCGVGRALYASLFALLRLQGFCRAYGGITLPNPGSIGLHEAMGFKLLAVYRGVGYKFGAWRDVGWWELFLRDLPEDPASPLKIAAAKAHPGWNAALEAGLPLLHF